MNILQVLPELNFGGVETGTIDLAKELIKRGHKSIIISNGGALLQELKASGVKHYSLPVHKKNPLVMFKMVKTVKMIIKEENIDVVHARSRVPALVSFLACRQSETAFITTCHGYYQKHFFSRVMGWGKLIIVSSHIIGWHMINDFKVPAKRVRLIARGVDLNKFKFNLHTQTKSQFIVGIVGRITPLKGHIYFLQAMALVAKQIPNLKVWIIGDAPPDKKEYLRKLRSLVNQLGLDKCVEFLGSRADIPELMNELDVLVMATTTPEAFGRVIIEAGASGLPVVATSVGGIVDILEDRLTGLLVPPKDYIRMSEAVISLWKGKELAVQLAKNLRHKVETDFTLAQMIDKTIKVYEEAVNVQNILVVKISAIGDVVLAIPSLRAIRAKFPHSRLWVLTSTVTRALLQNCPYINNIIVYDKERKDQGLIGLWRLGADLRKINFDFVVDLQNSKTSHILSFLSGAFRRYGYGNKKFSFLLNYKIKDDKLPVSPVTHQLQVLKLFGVDSIDQKLELWPSPEDKEYVNDFLGRQWIGEKQILIGLNIGSSKKWQSKRWPIENWAKLCDELAIKHNWRILLTGGKEDLPLAEELAKITTAKPIMAVGQTSLTQLAALIGKCHIYLTSDSAPMHIALSMGVNCLAIFGPTDSRRHSSLDPKLTVIEKNLKCQPCYKAKCRDLECLKQITVKEVLETVENIVNQKQADENIIINQPS